MHEAALVLGMVLHRFRLIDHKHYKLKIKETLTIKPDGFRVRVKRRSDHPPAAAQAAAPPSATPVPIHPNGTRNDVTAHPMVPRHGTPLLVLYGSNLGTAEEIAGRIAQDGESYGFTVTLAALDDYVAKLPPTGPVILVAASYNGTAPDNATQFVKWLDSGLPKNGLAEVRYAVFGCGNSDWAADLSIRAAHARRATGGTWRAQRLCPRRGRCPQRSRRPVREIVRRLQHPRR